MYRLVRLKRRKKKRNEDCNIVITQERLFSLAATTRTMLGISLLAARPMNGCGLAIIEGTSLPDARTHLPSFSAFLDGLIAVILALSNSTIYPETGLEIIDEKLQKRRCSVLLKPGGLVEGKWRDGTLRATKKCSTMIEI